ncbi:MAG: shikimate kinase [Halobacteriales archaeon]
MRGSARAPGAATVVNALATYRGAAFAVDIHTEATVELDGDASGVTGEIAEGGDPALIERCVELVLEREGHDGGAYVETESEVPQASGLKSSSAAANAAVLATYDALDRDVDRKEAARLGVEAARDAGVTVTGAFDDAAASMLGGLAFTDNSTDTLVEHREFTSAVAVYVPDVETKSADADVSRTKRLASVVDTAYELGLDGDVATAMTVNGLAYCAALDFDPSPAVTALEHADGAGLSGTGPSFAAIADEDTVSKVTREWRNLPGTTMALKTDSQGASTTSDGT